MKNPIEETYPHITRWVNKHGWIEIGNDIYSYSFVRALDEGGVVWEGGADYPTLDKALQEMDQVLAIWLEETYGDYF